MEPALKHIYYVDIQCYIIREGYIVDINYGDNHHIGIYNNKRHVIDYTLDKHIFTTFIECEHVLKQIINEKRHLNFKIIDKLSAENEKLFCMLFNHK